MFTVAWGRLPEIAIFQKSDKCAFSAVAQGSQSTFLALWHAIFDPTDSRSPDGMADFRMDYWRLPEEGTKAQGEFVIDRQTTTKSKQNGRCSENLAISTRSRSKTVRPNWLECAELTIAQIGRQSTSPREGLVDFRAVTVRLLRTELEYIHSPVFAKRNAGKSVFAESLDWETRGNRSQVRGIDAAFSPLLSKLCQARLLKPDEERALFERMNFLLYQANCYRAQLDPNHPDPELIELVEELIGLANWHRERIVEANIRLVVSIVKKFVSDLVSFEDLLSDGIFSLMRAASKFDYAMGFRFSTYATQVIRRDIYRAVMLRKRETQRFTTSIADIETEVAEDDGQVTVREQRWEYLRSRLGELMGQLDRREQFILRARFALGPHRKVHALQALASKLGISKERVRQLEKRALEKLRNLAESHRGEEVEGHQAA